MKLYTKDLVKKYKSRTVVNHVSIDVEQGEIVGLLGPNGAGKTTSFYMIVGLVKPAEGNIWLDDVNITNMPMHRRARLGIGYLPQEPQLDPQKSVRTIVEEGLAETEEVADHLGGQAEAWAVMLYTTIGMIKELNSNLAVLPGHYMNWEETNDDLIFTTSLANAIERNKKIYSITSEAGFIQFIKDNMRSQPEEYATIRLINANKEQVNNDRAEELDIGKNECAATAYAKAQTEKDAGS